jgi:hypothetical protein
MYPEADWSSPKNAGSPGAFTVRHLSDARFGHFGECHVVLANPFQEIAIGFSSWFPEEAVVFRPALSEPWFHSIRPVGHTVRGNGIQHLLVEPAAAFGIIARLQRDHRLERFERLDRGTPARSLRTAAGVPVLRQASTRAGY